MMKHLVWKCVFVLALATCGLLANTSSARAGDHYYYAPPVIGTPSYYLGPVYSYGYTPYYAAPAPVVGYGYGFVAGPPVWNMDYPRPAYYYPETFGWGGGYYPAYPAEVKYKYRHGYVKVEIND